MTWGAQGQGPGHLAIAFYQYGTRGLLEIQD